MNINTKIFKYSPKPIRAEYEVNHNMPQASQCSPTLFYHITDEQRSFLHDIAERYITLGGPTYDNTLNRDIQVVWSLLDSNEYTDTDQISLKYAREWYIHSFKKYKI